MGKVVSLVKKEPVEDLILGVYEAIEEYKKQGKTNGWIHAHIAGCLSYYNQIFEVHSMLDLPENKGLTVYQMIEKSGDY
jgi:hypothetical protein